MSIPNFTAEASLYQMSEHYRMVASSQYSRGGVHAQITMGEPDGGGSNSAGGSPLPPYLCRMCLRWCLRSGIDRFECFKSVCAEPCWIY
jgi:hypothetical protein